MNTLAEATSTQMRRPAITPVVANALGRGSTALQEEATGGEGQAQGLGSGAGGSSAPSAPYSSLPVYGGPFICRACDIAATWHTQMHGHSLSNALLCALLSFSTPRHGKLEQSMPQQRVEYCTAPVPRVLNETLIPF